MGTAALLDDGLLWPSAISDSSKAHASGARYVGNRKAFICVLLPDPELRSSQAGGDVRRNLTVGPRWWVVYTEPALLPNSSTARIETEITSDKRYYVNFSGKNILASSITGEIC